MMCGDTGTKSKTWEKFVLMNYEHGMLWNQDERTHGTNKCT